MASTTSAVPTQQAFIVDVYNAFNAKLAQAEEFESAFQQNDGPKPPATHHRVGLAMLNADDIVMRVLAITTMIRSARPHVCVVVTCVSQPMVEQFQSSNVGFIGLHGENTNPFNISTGPLTNTHCHITIV